MSGPLLEQMEQMQEDMFGNYRKEKKTPKKIFFLFGKIPYTYKKRFAKKIYCIHDKYNWDYFI